MKRRLAGFDLNGWRDFCARSWLDRPGEDAIEDGSEVISGGIDGQAVHTGQDHRHPYVGGSQAGLAPHGKGDGWGKIGQEKRLSVRELLDNPFDHTLPLSASFRAMARNPKLAVMAIPDCDSTTERHQESYLAAMRLSGIQQPFLVWRPVLAVLATLEAYGFDDKDRIGVVIQERNGFSSQILTLRRAGLLTPERRKTGVLHSSKNNLEERYAKALSRLKEHLDERDRRNFSIHGALPARIALGEPQEPEVLRLKNGYWAVLQPFDLPLEPEPEVFAAIAKQLKGCDHILFATRMGTALASEMMTEFRAACTREPIHLAPDTIALGALEAARRLNRGDPAFFDFLPQVSTLVQGPSGAINHNLVPRDDVLPAGKVYRSRAPARFALLPGQDVISVYLRKETEEAPRLARLESIAPVTDVTDVELSLEQQPAAGRARLTLSSPAFFAPHVVDFDGAEKQKENWEEIIARHKRKRPTIPNRMVLPSGMQVWRGMSNRAGLSDRIKGESARTSPDWSALANLLSARPEGVYAISSDGELPSRLSLGDEAALDQMIARAHREVVDRLKEGTYISNDALRFLTWTFRRCPDDVVSLMIQALENPEHSFRRRGWSTLVWQGLGRTLHKSDSIRCVISILLSLSIDDWNKDHTACMAFLISRTDDAPRLLTRNDVNRLADVVCAGLRRELGGDYGPRFIYLPILLVGLMRWRMVDPYSLVTTSDPVANRLATLLDDILQDLERRQRTTPRLERHHELLRKSRDELAGEGGHNHLLADLYGLTAD